MVMKNPMQPIGLDPLGTSRFKRNSIVSILLDTHPNLTLNDLASMAFSQTDWEQFYQLIGYSVGGYFDLSGVSDESKDLAEAIVDGGLATKLVKNEY